MTANYLLYPLLGSLVFTLYLTKKNAYQYKNYHTAYSKFDVTVFADSNMQFYCDLKLNDQGSSIYPNRSNIGSFTYGSPDQSLLTNITNSKSFHALVHLLENVKDWEPSCTFIPGQVQIHISGSYRHEVLKKNSKELDQFFDGVDRLIKLIETDLVQVS